MHENTTRLFRDVAINPAGGKGADGAVHLPGKLESLISDPKTVFCPLAASLAKQASIDERLKKALKPVISDISILKPEKYYSISIDAHEAICKQLRTERSEETRAVLAGLVDLLKENIALTSLFNQNMSNIRKA